MLKLHHYKCEREKLFSQRSARTHRVNVASQMNHLSSHYIVLQRQLTFATLSDLLAYLMQKNYIDTYKISLRFDNSFACFHLEIVFVTRGAFH